MHGIIFSALRGFAEKEFGSGTWVAVLKQAALPDRVYLQVQEYPDAEAIALVLAASSLTGQPVAALLEKFGEFIVPDLMKMNGHLLRPQWKTLDVIEHTEATIHKVIRVKNPGATPPELKTTRLSSDELLLIYTSSRRMCALAIGIGKGLAHRFLEDIVITERVCMHRGASHCEIVFRTIQSKQTGKPPAKLSVKAAL